MIPILYSENTTQFNTNGIGRLSDAISCVITEERNGQFELEMEYAAEGKRVEDIGYNKIILAKPSQENTLQAFRIYKIEKSIMGGTITVNAQHISYQLAHIPLKPFGASSLTDALTKLVSESMETNPFTFTSDKTSAVACGSATPIMCRSMLGGHEGSLLDVYGGEWKFDNYTCSLLSARGADNGVTIRYGKNLVYLQQEENIANTITGVVPFWKATDSNDCVYANPVYANNADSYPYKRTEIIDFSDQFEAKPTSAQLTVMAQQYIEKNNIGHPSVSLDVDFVNLADTEEYKGIAPLENILLCDTVTVIFEKLGISEKAKVVRTEYDCLAERYKSVEIGTIRSSLAVTIADQGSAIETTLEKSREFIKDATGWLTNGAGYVIANKNADGSWKELLFLDQPTTALATKVLRINENGIGFASGAAGTFDSWVYYQAWTLDGHLSLGGVNNAYGFLQILNNLGAEIGRWNKDGIKIFNANGIEVFRASDNDVRFRHYSSNGNYWIDVKIGGSAYGITIEDSNNDDEVNLDNASLLFTDNDESMTNVGKGGVYTVYESGSDLDETEVNSDGVRVENSTSGTTNHYTEMKADGFYVDGTKLEVNTTGYTGTVDVETNLEVDFDNEEYSADVYTLTFKDGILTSVD